MAEELLGLFLTNAAIDEHPSAADLYEERPHGPCAEVQVVGRIGAGPKLLGNHPKHSAPVKFKMTCIDRKKVHTYSFMVKRNTEQTEFLTNRSDFKPSNTLYQALFS